MDDYLRKLREQQEQFRRVTEGPLRDFQENSAILRAQDWVRALDTTRLSVAARAAEMELTSSRTAALVEMANASMVKFALPESISVMESYLKQRSEMQDALERLALPSKALSEFVQSMSATMAATRLAAASLDWNRIGGLWSATEQERNTLTRVTDRLAVRHAGVIASFEIKEGLLASAPSFVSELPTMSVFVHTQAVRSITPHESLERDEEEEALSLRTTIVTETGSFLEATLHELNPAYPDQYRAARARSVDRGPDWWGQGSSSLRKLIKGVLHTAAPNEAVLPWAKQHNKELDRVGRPTRATKIEWLCQFIPNDAYRAYVRTELNSALALIELLDATQHLDEFAEFAQQYDWTVLRVEVAIRHILTIWKSRPPG